MSFSKLKNLIKSVLHYKSDIVERSVRLALVTKRKENSSSLIIGRLNNFIS